MTGWSNDQLNAIYIYDPATGTLILSVDGDGFYYSIGDKLFQFNADGFFARVVPSNGSHIAILPKDFYGGTRLEMQPKDYPPGVSWNIPGRVFSSYDEDAADPGNYYPWSILSSPTYLDGTHDDEAQVTCFGTGTKGTGSGSTILFTASDLLGNESAEMSQGSQDLYGGSSALSFTSATDAIVDVLNAAWFGTGMVTSRVYAASFNGTVQSSTAGDRIGLRIYSNTTASLAGATLRVDYGEIAVARANTPQPMGRLEWQDDGVAGDPFYLILAARRVAGGGTCIVTTYARRLEDVGPI